MTTDNRPRRLGTGRLEAFSDGVFAIVITLLVLELAIPAGSGDHLLRAIAGEWPTYLAYVVSFASIGAIWLEHSAITEHLRGADVVLLRLNLLLLLCVSFIPFPTKLMGEYAHEVAAERVAVTIYGLTLLLASTLVSVMWRHAVRAQLVDPGLADEETRMLTKRLDPGLLAYVVLIGLGLFVPTVAIVGFLAIAVYFMVPLGSIRRHRRARA